MPPPRRNPPPIGATQAPDFDSDQLESVELDGLDAGFELEDARVGSASLAKADGSSSRFQRVHLVGICFGECKLRSAQLTDVRGERVDAANGDWGGVRLKRTSLSDARLTGVSFAEARLEEVSFTGCKLDYANFRHSTIKQVSFEDCVLTGADFQGARIDATIFSHCRLLEVDFTKAELSRVDLRGSDLGLAGSVLGLRGAIVDPLQLMELAPRFAQELGVTVEDR